MACPLDRLAPETRVLIYEYVLAFDTPLKHVTKMQPFVKKLTGVEPKSGSDSEIETITDLQRVNTSILTANKLIYTEAIAVFYKHNTIRFDAELCASEDIVSPLATDLSLARHIVMEADDALDPEVYARFGKVFDLSIPAIFPKVRTCSVNVSADTSETPSSFLIGMHRALQRQDMFDRVSFNGIGSVTAVIESTPCIKIVIQSRWTIDRWKKPVTPFSAVASALEDLSASALYKFSRVPSQFDFAQKARGVFNTYKALTHFPEIEDVEQDGWEFWTAVDACLCYFQGLHP